MFRSVDHALRWAYRISGIPVVKGSSVFSLMAGGGKAELSAQDKRGQAALIWSLVDRTVDTAIGRAYILAQYCHALDCRDWSEKTSLSDEQRARVRVSGEVSETLSQAVITSLPTGIHSRRGYSGLVKCYFGQQIGVHSLRQSLSCRMDAVPEHRKKAYDALDKVGYAVIGRLEEEMRGHGLLED